MIVSWERMGKVRYGDSDWEDAVTQLAACAAQRFDRDPRVAILPLAQWMHESGADPVLQLFTMAQICMQPHKLEHAAVIWYAAHGYLDPLQEED